MSKRPKSLYVVVKGHQPGIYTEWSGDKGAQEQVNGVSGAIYKGFHNRDEAAAWLHKIGEATLQSHAPQLLKFIGKKADPNFADIQPTDAKPNNPTESKSAKSGKSKSGKSKAGQSKSGKSKPGKSRASKSKNSGPSKSEMVDACLQAGNYVIHTDGGAIKNPGPGGYGVVLRYQEQSKELSSGYRLTTNNRMELLACIEGLKAIKLERKVLLISDSKYVVNGIQKGWAKRWRANGWMRNAEEEAINADLWAELLELCERHQVELKWVKGHAGDLDNERCDELATAAIQSGNLSIDEVYEEKRKARPANQGRI